MEKTIPETNSSDSSIECLKYHGQTLKEILKNHDCKLLDPFREFLIQEYCDENLDFWLDVDDYKQLNYSQAQERSAKRIYRLYIREKASREINTDRKVKDAISKNMKSPDLHIFDEAQRDIFHLMEKGPFVRFLQKERTNA